MTCLFDQTVLLLAEIGCGSLLRLGWEKPTGKNNGFLFLDTLGYLKNTLKTPNLAKWDKSQTGNSQLSSQIGTCLTLPNLGFLWVFFKYPKISKNGNPLFFPVAPLVLQFIILIMAWNKLGHGTLDFNSFNIQVTIFKGRQKKNPSPSNWTSLCYLYPGNTCI